MHRRTGGSLDYTLFMVAYTFTAYWLHESMFILLFLFLHSTFGWRWDSKILLISFSVVQLCRWVHDVLFMVVYWTSTAPNKPCDYYMVFMYGTELKVSLSPVVEKICSSTEHQGLSEPVGAWFCMGYQGLLLFLLAACARLEPMGPRQVRLFLTQVSGSQ